MAILLVVMVGILSSISFAYNSSTDTEMRNTAKNVASYTLEYLRARTVTRGTSSTRLTALGITGTSTGTYGWYIPGTNASGAFPSMIDAENLPLQSNGKPCNYLWTYVRSASKTDGNSNSGSGGGIAAGGSAFRFSSKHAALPTETYSVTTPLIAALAWTTTLQGYVSVRERLPTNDVTSLSATESPAPEDKNMARMRWAPATYPNNANGRYRTGTEWTSAGPWTGLVIRFPGVYVSATQPGVTSFTPLTGYVAKVYTTDAAKVDNTKQAYNPYYTNGSDGTTKSATQAYRGFRVLTQIVARSTAALDTNYCRHVQYYDVSVTVLWMNGTREASYELVSRIIAY
jgi:hypothetical protein